MTVGVVTDSTSDIPVEVAQELGITVVPLYIHFGNEVFQDGVDLDADEFYRRLETEPKLPKTSAPSSGTFIETYERLAAETDEIISLHISTRLSATYNSALVAKEGTRADCHIEVVDSLSTSIGLALLAITAAKEALTGASLEQIAATVNESIPRTHYFGMLDTLQYLYKGGRIGKAQTFLGSMLNVKPLLTLRDGEAYPVERVRGRPRALDRLCELVERYPNIKELAIADTTTPEDLETLAVRLSALFPREQTYRSRCGSTMGTYLGPGALTVALIEEAV
ncbi:MAG: DegV family protein [Dehalococcoidia bacterium]|nr:DegV family protein [Dehalococcoidia bacterium]